MTAELRWSVADTPYCGDYQEMFSSVNQRLNGIMPFVDSLEPDDPAFDKHIETLYSILVSSLNELRKNTFAGAQRPLLYVDFGDMSDEERLMFIKRCNDHAKVAWYSTSVARA